MSDKIKVFFIEPTGRYQRSLRRYTHDRPCPKLTGQYSYCNASVYIDTVKGEDQPASGDKWPHDDPRWPKHCERCGGEFSDHDRWILMHHEIYRSADTGIEFPLHMAPIGACWNAAWLSDHGIDVGPDGRSLVCRVPGPHDWCIDGRASNCTKQDDKVHRCWVRHGRPEDGTLHVDKNGNTCSAGAGSIAVPGWHGFLHNGYLVS